MDRETLTGRRAGAERVESALRAIPSVSFLIDQAKRSGESSIDESALAKVIQPLVDDVRADILAGATPGRDEITDGILLKIRNLDRQRLVPAINASGILIHTNLGRAPVSVETAQAMADAASSYVPLEIDVETNERGSRMQEIASLLRVLTGAEDAIVVNNNAAAILLALSALAAGRGVIVSRGEAVEIGGGFRVPDVLRQSGATLIEVGTTNRTYPTDYEAAIDEMTAAMLKVHPSNFQMTGFVRSASVAELVSLAAPKNVLVIEDLGSGALLDTSIYGIDREPTISDSIGQGVSLVTASGDKLLGGPQAGIIAGERRWVEQVARHPLARAVRADKTCLAGIAATLRHYLRGEAEQQIPIWRMISAKPNELMVRAQALLGALNRQSIQAEVVATDAAIGGGSLPGQTLKSAAIALFVGPAVDFARRLRMGNPPVFGRIEHDRVVLDLRAVEPEQDQDLLSAILIAHPSPHGTVHS